MGKTKQAAITYRVEHDVMALKTKTPATYEDLEALPVGWVGEILAGTLYGHPRPAVGHAQVESALAALLKGPFDQGVSGPGGWRILVEPELHLDRDVLVPDLAAWRRERMPRLPSPDEPFITLPPDWVCEVLSPSTQHLDRGKKLPRYLKEGVGHLWLIDPVGRSLELYERTARGWLLTGTHSENAVVRPPPFDDRDLDLGLVWG